MKYLLLLLFLVCLFSCKTTQQKSVEKNLLLSRKEYKTIKNDNEIIIGLYELIKDSIDIEKIKAPLTDYFIDRSKEELMATIEMYQVFGNKVSIRSTDVDTTNSNIPRINSKKELELFKKQMNSRLEVSKKAFNEKYKKKDSI